MGFANGIVRFLLLNEKGFFLLRALKVHPNGISHLRFSGDGRKVVIVSEVGDIFFLEVDAANLHNYEPFCLFETKYQINSIVWNKFDEKILLACKDGCIYEIKVPKKVVFFISCFMMIICLGTMRHQPNLPQDIQCNKVYH